MYSPGIVGAAAAHVKKETSLLHAALEEEMMPRLLQVKSNSDYARLLQLFYGYFHPLEEILSGFITGDMLPGYPERRKSGWLLQDLAALGYAAGPVATAQMLPSISSPSSAMGALYVMEGSTLGGKHILLQLKKQLPTLPTASCSFFSGYGAHTGPMWKSFVAALNEIDDPSHIATVTASANDTFLNFSLWIKQHP